MSEENVEIVRWGYEAWNRRDFDQILELADPEIEWTLAQVRVPGVDAVYQGHEGVRRFWETFIEPWEQITVEVEELRDSGDRWSPLFGFGRSPGMALKSTPLSGTS